RLRRGPARADDLQHAPCDRECGDRARRSRDPRHARTRITPRRRPRRVPRRRSVSRPGSPSVPRRRRSGMTEAPVRVLLVDDDDLMRAGLKAVLSSDESVEVVGEAGDGRTAVERARTLRPDLVLMDVRMPGLDGIAATREVLDVSTDVKVVILTTFEQD